MNNLNEFWDIFFSNEIIIILLVVLVIVLITLIIYLIKLEKGNKNIEPVLDDSLEEEKDLLDELKEESTSPLFSNETDEENAIINVDELLSSCKEIKEETGLDNSEIIDIYEKEQEKKAIISYEELLKNAAALSINYEKPQEKELEEPDIKIIEISDEPVKSQNIEVESTNKVISYVKEEEFLQLLKQFRMDLET